MKKKNGKSRNINLLKNNSMEILTKQLVIFEEIKVC